jgi:hypothetical protein
VLSPQPDRSALLRLREPGVIENLIDEWKQDFDSILFDTSAINPVNGSNLPGTRAAAACDGTLLVVMAGRTTESMVKTAAKKLEDAGALLVGSVLNDRDHPPLLQELIRESDRIRPFLPRLANWLQDKAAQMPILRLET